MREYRLAVARTARVQVLGDPERAREVWVVLHGFGQLASEFLAPFRAIETAERAIVAPEALNRFYKEKAGARNSADRPVGATWMTREDREAEIADYVAYLDAVAARFADGRALTTLGFSQGVATLMRWVALGTSRMERVIAWAGEIPGDVDIAGRRDRFPSAGIDLVLGANDEYRAWVDVEAMHARLDAASLAYRVHAFDGGHRLDRATLVALAEDAGRGEG